MQLLSIPDGSPVSFLEGFIVLERLVPSYIVLLGDFNIDFIATDLHNDQHCKLYNGSTLSPEYTGC